MAGAFMSAGDYVHASRRRLTMIAAVEDVLRQVDVLLCASAMDPPSRIDEAKEVERTYPRQARTPFNVTGHPALAMMAGISSSGLPLSVQLVGRNFAEATLFQIAREWERAAGTDTKDVVSHRGAAPDFRLGQITPYAGERVICMWMMPQRSSLTVCRSPAALMVTQTSDTTFGFPS
jgi:hypothetical protein